MRNLFILLVFSLPAVTFGHQAPLTAARMNPEAPPQVKQYGQLQGSWKCIGYSQNADGEWQAGAQPATWTWYYVLDGYAVQDVWVDAKGGVGTNLRTYDAEEDKWYMVWATKTQARFDEFEATYQDGNIVMTGERWARAAFPQHLARITFHNISEEHFDWKSEWSAPNDGENWTENSRLSCDRM